MAEIKKMVGIVEDTERKRASYALECVMKVKDDNSKKRKEYRQQAKNLPTLLHENGLAQTLAFLKSKDTAHKELYSNMQAWLIEKAGIAWEKTDKPGLLDRLLEENSIVYMQASREAMSLASWLKRLAAAEIPEVEDGAKTKENQS